MNISGLAAALLFFITTLFIHPAIYALDLFQDDDVIWQSGSMNIVSLRDIEGSAEGNNQHPVELNKNDIIYALDSIRIWEGEKKDLTDELDPVFSKSETRKLGQHISKALRKAKPGQDILFAVQSAKPKIILLKQKFYTSGRAFYKDGMLNIIIGDYKRGVNDAFEKTLDPSGEARQTYRFNFGSRGSASSDFKEQILRTPGVENKKRKNWFVIDVKTAADAYLAAKEARENPQTPRDKQYEIEAAKLAKERREMRLEMARLRKEMKEGNSSSTGQTVEQRLGNLDKLHNKGLISDDEYANKRDEILKDL